MDDVRSRRERGTQGRRRIRLRQRSERSLAHRRRAARDGRRAGDGDSGKLVRMQATRPSSPAERYLRALWSERVAFAVVVIGCLAAAAIVTALQPTLYASQALLSVK